MPGQGLRPGQASRTSLTVYDALYIAAALSAGAPLATFDDRLRRVAIELGVEIRGV